MRCWGEVFATPRQMAYSPARVGLCGAVRLADGIGFCSAHGDGAIRCLGAERYVRERGWERGGIRATVRATRAASDEHLIASARARLRRLLEGGVTTAFL